MRAPRASVVGWIILLAGARTLGAPDAPTGDDDAAPDNPLRGKPVITEVLFNVPRGDDADANLDGRREANADEFVELFNPNPTPINLRGYTITNHITTYDPDTKRGVRFTFPAFTLAPGALVVVFNGYDATIPGPVGTEKRAPAKPNENFAGAFVFTIDPGSRTCALANSGDFVLLSDAHGNPIDAVTWGDADEAPPSDTLRVVEVDDNPKSSVQRVTGDGPLRPHRRIDRHAFSPGAMPGAKQASPEDGPRVPGGSE